MSALHRILPPADSGHAAAPIWLHDTAGSRQIEALALTNSVPGALMERAGTAVARLALALAPHARSVWVVCGPGNNGGDGLVAARQLHQAGLNVRVSLLVDPHQLPADAGLAWQAAQTAGVPMHVDWPSACDAQPPELVIDALLGLGQSRAPAGRMATWIARINTWPGAQVLAIDVPTGLCSDTGRRLGDSVVRADDTLALLTLKPGLFTHQGRDQTGAIWFDSLSGDAMPARLACAQLTSRALLRATWPPRRHAQHKGSFGDLWVLGGAPGMRGAAHLAAAAALAAGAGRIYLSVLGDAAHACNSGRPELMQRAADAWQAPGVLEAATVVCGCGGGALIGDMLPAVLQRTRRLVLDADALNAIASQAPLATALRERAQRGQVTVLTPHPLEAARLAGCDVAKIQADRLGQAKQLAERFGAVVLLKGSGTVIASPGELPLINSSGNARLASPGSGDVLAGWLGAAWSATPAGPIAQAWQQAAAAAAASAWIHGQAAEQACGATTGGAARLPLRASDLIEAMRQVVDSAAQSA